MTRVNVNVKKNHGSYEIYIDGEFYCSCDSEQEVDEELEENFGMTYFK